MRRPSLCHLLLLSCALFAAFPYGTRAADTDIVATLTELATDGCSQKADIFFALDSSHSVGKANFNLVRKFIHEIVSKLVAKSNNFRFGIVVFSDKADMVIKLKDYNVTSPVEKAALLKFLLLDLAYKSGKTVTGEAFQLIRELGFLKENGHRSDAKPVVVLLTDGRANGRADPVVESAKLRDDSIGASIVALGVGTGISRETLEKLASKKEYVTIVNDFEDLGKVSRLITEVLCGSENKPATGPAAKSAMSCGAGLELIAGTCVPVPPKCKLLCPKGFLLVFPCKCIPDVSVGTDCTKKCRESEILVRGCKCVPRHVPLTPVEPKVCNKRCPGAMTLNKALCQCECKQRCPGANFNQEKDCTCSCSMRCRAGLALNKRKCVCQKVDCPPRFEFFEGKCHPIVRKYCPPGQVLFRDICKRGEDCPPGYKIRADRKCYKISCDPGYKKTKSGECKKMCGGQRYYFNDRCNDPIQCGEHQYFKVNAPGCPRTCEVPVPLVKCQKERSPQCACAPYFLLHEGKCIHPSDCPNIPICIRKADVIFMLDSSLTVTEHNFYMMKNFVRDVVQMFYLSTGKRQRVGVMRFNHHADIIMDLDSWEHNTHEEIQKKIEYIEYQPGLTFLGEALHTVRTKMWKRRAGMRDDVPHVTILITDGTDTNGQVDQYYEAKKLRDSGVFFVTIAMGDEIGVGEARRSLEKLAGPEGRVFIFGLREFQDIHGLVARVLTFHCEKPLCPLSYLTYGKCVGDYKTISRVEYVSENFHCKKTINHDYKKVRCACPKPEEKEGPCVKMYKIVTRATYTLDKAKGICASKFKDFKVRCSCPKDEVVESECKEFKRTVKTTAYTLIEGGGLGNHCNSKTTTKTLKCASGYATLNYTLYDKPHLLADIVKSNLTNVTKIMTESLATALNVHPYEVANLQLDEKLLGSCQVPYKALHPFAVLVKKDAFFFVFKGSKFKFKPESVKVTLPACPKPIRKIEPCRHNFKVVEETLFKFEHKTLTCAQVHRTKEVRCSCPKPEVETAHCNGEIVPVKVYEQRVNTRNQCDDILWTGSASCARSCSKRMDIAFIIDSSDSVRGANFEYIRRFIVAVARKMDVSRDNTHIAVLKYSSVEEMRVIFNFVAHFHIEHMATRVMEMKYSPGSTYTGDALQKFRSFLLNKINGYRGGSGAGVDSVAILVTDGASNSAIDPIKEANKIKALGCSIVTVGVGDDVQSHQLRAIASEPADIHNFKTDSFRELTDPVFVDAIITATCRVGKVNKVSVKQEWINKIRDLQSRNIEINFGDLGLKEFDPKDLALFEFKLKGTYAVIVGTTQSSKSSFLERVRDTIAKAIEVHPFSIRKLRVSPALAISGQLSAAKLDKLKALISTDKLKLDWRGPIVIDKASFTVLSPEALKTVRIASEAADKVFGIVRPLGRLLIAAKQAVTRIVREDARKLADKEVADLGKLVQQCEKAAEELTTLSSKARKDADKAAADKCLEKLKFVFNSAEVLAKHAMYIAYFAPQSDRDTIVKRHDKVAESIAEEQKGFKFPEKAAPAAAAAAKKKA